MIYWERQIWINLCRRKLKRAWHQEKAYVFLSFFSVFLTIIFIRKKHFCGVVAETWESKNNILYFRFFATSNGMDSEFSFLYTAFTKKRSIDGKNTTMECGPGEFDCDDDSCIHSSLWCDDEPNCKFKKDEENCNVSVKKKT